MSWSVSATGTPAEVKELLAKQFEAPLDEAPRGIAWDAEKQTVAQVKDNIEQVLDTYDPEQKVQVTAYGHGSEGHYQQVQLSINPYSDAPAQGGTGTDPQAQAAQE